MSLKPFSFDPPTSLALEGDISWKLKEPVLVIWRDSDQTLSLGQPCSFNSNTPTLVTMWVGETPDKKLAVVLLQMTISFKVSSRKKSFDLFLILPSDKLCVMDNTISINEVPPDVYQRLEQARSESSERRRLSHLKFQLDCPSQVLMNVQPTSAKPISGTALHIMLLLKSLSQVLSFDAYIGYSTYAIQALRTLKTGLDSGARTPEVDLKNAYAGAGGSLDNWEQYNTEHFARSANDIAPSRKRPRRGSSSSTPPRQKDFSSQYIQELEPSNPPPYVQLEEAPPTNPKNSHSEVLVARTDSDYAPSPVLALSDDGDYIPETPPKPIVGVQDITNDPSIATTNPIVEPNDTTLRTSMTSWILAMKRVDGDFYKAHRLHPVLLSLASAALRQDTDQFIKAKARGTTIVLAKDAAATIMGQRIHTTHQETPKLLHEQEMLTSWMYGFDLNTDVVMLPVLRVMALWAVAHKTHTNAKSRMVDQIGDDAKTAELEKSFRRCEAECIAEFYTHLVSRKEAQSIV
ncbi:hypothetical protein N7495_006365 [Penicillium taxi]|uniref:uncharacterized protein n=1 Tax=Penicillium taxi TaxID=168475 RepID=UPI002545A66A|nr:uncharacterized protein N7495_006365 [Penicillium taxi]KAJ5894674.1 hypothetical protein N7495_006365 [Penicillium taxi]